MLIDSNDNRCEELLSEECHAMAHEEESSVVMANEEMYERKVMISNDNESEHEKSNQESKAVETDKGLKQKFEKGCGKCNMNQENSSFIDEMREMLVAELKKRIGNSNV